MPTIPEIIDADLPFTKMAEISKAIALGYRASAAIMRANPVLGTNPMASSGHIKRSCIDHFLAAVPGAIQAGGISARIESNRNGSSRHIVLRADRTILTAHHVQSTRSKMIKSSLYNRVLSSPNYDLFSDAHSEHEAATLCCQLLHGSKSTLEFISLVVPDPSCKVALYTRAIPLPTIEEIKEEKIEDSIGALFNQISEEIKQQSGHEEI